MDITERLKQKLDELEVERRLQEVVAQAETAVVSAVARAGEVAHERHDEWEGYLGRAQALVDERTGGKYADTVGKVRDQASRGLAKLAEQRHRDD